MTGSLFQAVRQARAALWQCALAAAEAGCSRVEAACDGTRGTVNDCADQWGVE